METRNTLYNPLVSRSPIQDDTTIDITPLTRQKPKYDAFQSPPNFEMAKNHGKAKRILVYEEQQRRSLMLKCPCCLLPLEGKPMPLTADLKKLYPLGSGYALYFRSVKYCIALLGIMFAINGIFNVVSNAMEKDCAVDRDTPESDYCVQDSIMSYTIANKRNNASLLTIQVVLNMVTVLAMLVFFQYFRLQVRKIAVETDAQTVTPSDYTIKVIGLEPEADENKIRQWIQTFADEMPDIKYTKINRAFDISRYVELHKRKEILVIKKTEEQDNTNRFILEDEIEKIDIEIDRLRHRELKGTNTVFISFQKAEHAQYLVKKYKKAFARSWLRRLISFCPSKLENFHGETVSIKRAPEPTDIVWENQNYDEMEKFKRVMINRFISSCVVILCFVMVVVISWGQNIVREKLGKESRVIPLLSILASYLVVTVNYVLWLATRYLSDREKHSTYTEYFTNVASRLSASMFINTAFTTVLARLVTLAYFGEFNNVKESLDPFNFYRKSGVLENMFYIFLSNAIVGPLYTMFNPFYFLKLYQRRKALKEGETSTMTQQRAHLIFEGMQTDLSWKNAVLAKTVLVTAFFAPAMPLALVISIFALIFSYWSDKYTLLRRNALPASLDDTLTVHMIKIFELSAVMFAIGNLVFMLTLQNESGVHDYFVVPNSLIITTIVISVVYLLAPRKKINAVLFHIPEEVETTEEYNEARGEFPTDYIIENPVTRRYGLREYEEFVNSMERSGRQPGLSMTSSMKKGGFYSLLQNHLKDLVFANIESEPVEVQKMNNFAFLDAYATNVPVMGMIRQKSLRERNVEILFAPPEDLNNQVL